MGFNDELKKALIEERLRRDLRDNLESFCSDVADAAVLCVKRMAPALRDYYAAIAKSEVEDGEETNG